MTVRTVRSICRLRSAVSSRYSDSGVVTRMCGGVRRMPGALRRRRVACADGCGDPRSRRCRTSSASRRDPASGQREVLVDVRAQRLERRHVDDAHLVGQRRRRVLLRTTRRGLRETPRASCRIRWAPRSACAVRAWISRHPRACAGVGDTERFVKPTCDDRMKPWLFGHCSSRKGWINETRGGNPSPLQCNPAHHPRRPEQCRRSCVTQTLDRNRRFTRAVVVACLGY